MRLRHSLIPYALETVPRPGSREIRVRQPSGRTQVRNQKGECP